jgi:TolA-binding protein
MSTRIERVVEKYNTQIADLTRQLAEARGEIEKLRFMLVEMDELESELKATGRVADTWRDRSESQAAEIERLREGLRKLEWEANKFSGEDRAYCPACKGFIKEGHDDDNCWLAALLEGKDEKA